MGFLKPDLFTRRCGVLHSADLFLYSVKDGRGRPSLHYMYGIIRAAFL